MANIKNKKHTPMAILIIATVFFITLISVYFWQFLDKHSNSQNYPNEISELVNAAKTGIRTLSLIWDKHMNMARGCTGLYTGNYLVPQSSRARF
jgi:hypothetical protein